MSEQRMSLDNAKTIATGYGAHMVNEVRAARTILACGDVLDTLESRAADDRKTAAGMTWAAPGAAGRAHAYAEAAKLIREALDPSSAN